MSTPGPSSKAPFASATAEKAARETQSARRAVLFTRTLTYLFVVPLAVFAMLPLVWMILTAFKQTGQAFKLRFWPETSFVVADIPVRTGATAGEPVVFFGHVAPGAREVAVAGDFNGWKTDKNLLTQVGDAWIGRFSDIPPGPHEYKIVVNGNDWKLDPANPKKQGDNSLVVVAPQGETVAGDLPAAISIEGGQVKARLLLASAETVSLTMPGASQPLVLKRDGEPTAPWLGSAPAPEVTLAETIGNAGPRASLSYSLPFKAALGTIYTLDNFRGILLSPQTDKRFARFFFNSFVVATGTGALTCILCVLAAYAFAKKQFKGREVLFRALLASMLIPGMVFVVPQFSMVLSLGWINSYFGMVVPHVGNVFGLFLLRQHISAIPDDLFCAADIDGASEAQRLRHVVFPLAWPILVTLFLLVFIGQWSNFLWQLIVNTPDSPFLTLPVALQYFKGQYGQDWEKVMAGACFSLVPIAALVLATQRFLIEGITAGAVKE